MSIIENLNIVDCFEELLIYSTSANGKMFKHKSRQDQGAVILMPTVILNNIILILCFYYTYDNVV